MALTNGTRQKHTEPGLDIALSLLSISCFPSLGNHLPNDKCDDSEISTVRKPSHTQRQRPLIPSSVRFGGLQSQLPPGCNCMKDLMGKPPR